MVDVKENAPLISLLTRAILATIMAIVGDVSSLIDFFSFTVWFFYGLSFTSLIILKIRARRSGADDSEVFSVPIVLPFIMLLVSVYLTLVPIIAAPQWPFLYAALFMLSGLIFYFPFVCCKVQVPCFDKVTVFAQLLFQVGVPDKDI